MNLPLYAFDEDYVAKIRSELSITVLEKKTERNYPQNRPVRLPTQNRPLKKTNLIPLAGVELTQAGLGYHCPIINTVSVVHATNTRISISTHFTHHLLQTHVTSSKKFLVFVI